jgi:hypothetical protein
MIDFPDGTKANDRAARLVKAEVARSKSLPDYAKSLDQAY